jgi:hypothetical protein
MIFRELDTRSTMHVARRVRENCADLFKTRK